MKSLRPARALVPYQINVSFWSDGAAKQRWIVLPEPTNAHQRIDFTPSDEWKFPEGTVFVKHFGLPNGEGNEPLETRFIIYRGPGDVYGVTYKWRADRSDADLLDGAVTQSVHVAEGSVVRTQDWFYPSRQDCRTCHTALSGGVLGVKTRQLNLEVQDGGQPENQLKLWARLGMFNQSLAGTDFRTLPALAKTSDISRSLSDRARSWIDANCANCHRPGGTVGYFDARYSVPLPLQGLIDGQVLIDQGLDHARVIAPKDIWRSVLYLRAASTDAVKMPPLAHFLADKEGTRVLRDWINSLPGTPALAPPVISPPANSYKSAVTVSMTAPDPEAEIHFTTDGSAPGKSDPVYQKPVVVSSATVVRARAYKPGFVRSIAVQQTYTFDD